MNIIEQRVWDFLDGISNDQEKELVRYLVENDGEYRRVYEELRSFNTLIYTAEMDEPSMSFTKNVINRIDSEPDPSSIRTLIDKRIIYGITAFFLLAISTLLGFLFYQIDWPQTSALGTSGYRFFPVETPELSSSIMVYIFFFSDIIIGLYFLDYFFRNRFSTKNH